MKNNLLGLGIFLLTLSLVGGFSLFLINLNKTAPQEILSPLGKMVEEELTTVKNTFVPPPKPITILFAGDMMFDRWIRQKAVQNPLGYDFVLAGVKDTLINNDLVVANLEGPITDNPSISAGSAIGSTRNFIFTFDPSIATTLLRHNINLVNLGNNHILNFGEDGYEQTKKYLAQTGIGYFGDVGQNNDQIMVIKTIGDVKIALISYNQFTNDANSGKNIERTLAAIKSAALQSDLQIVYTHWGNEYQPNSGPVIKQTAHDFIDAGADLIIGSHPHVIQQTEVYQGKTIYYSLGNFVFDQYFSPETKTGLLVKVIIDPMTLEMSFEETKVELFNDGRTELMK